MASVEASQLSKAEHDELCCSYAALMLHDDGLEITVSFNTLMLLMIVFVGWKIEQGHYRLRKRCWAILANAFR